MAAKKDEEESGNAAHLLLAVLKVTPPQAHPPKPFHGGGPQPKIGAHAYALAALWLAERARPMLDEPDEEMFEHFVELARHQLRVGPGDTTKRAELYAADAKKASRIPCKIGIWAAHEAANSAWRGIYAGGAARPAFANWAKHLLKKASKELPLFVADVHALCIHLEALTLLRDRERERETSKPVVATPWRGCEGGRPSHFLMQLEDGTYALLGKQGARWQVHEGKRDDVVATIPDGLFGDAVRAVQ